MEYKDFVKGHTSIGHSIRIRVDSDVIVLLCECGACLSISSTNYTTNNMTTNTLDPEKIQSLVKAINDLEAVRHTLQASVARAREALAKVQKTLNECDAALYQKRIEFTRVVHSSVDKATLREVEP